MTEGAGKNMHSSEKLSGYRPAVSRESFIFIGIFLLFFSALGSKMGVVNMINTMMNTAYMLLQETVFYILAIAVLAGAVSGLFTEFGVVSLVHHALSGLMKPVYHLPGASILGVLATYLSDNPAILTLADHSGFRCFFKKYQLPALTNLGTSFGMGMVITIYMMGLKAPSGQNFIAAALLGNLGAIFGSIVSVRLMLFYTKREYGTEERCRESGEEAVDIRRYRKISEGSVGERFMNAMLDGGKSGVETGLAIIPGVLVICTIVLMLTNGPGPEGYTGGAYEGIGFLPVAGKWMNPVLKPLFGFTSPEAIAVPVTALGAAGASLGLIPSMVAGGMVNASDIGVFTAMCMCWSGYLSTHVAMMDRLNCSKMTGKAIFSHTIGGLAAGIFAHLLCLIFGI